jgi:hypothetical protein
MIQINLSDTINSTPIIRANSGPDIRLKPVRVSARARQRDGGQATIAPLPAEAFG